jgi:hypothetical protein
MQLSVVSLQYALGLTFVALAVYFLGLVIYRLYLSPISNFPGPKLAACTLWYEFYFDVVKRGRYTWKIGELHEEYGECTMVHCVSDCSQLRERTYHPDQSV